MESYKDFFPRARQVTYLDTAAEGLPLPAAEEALSAYYRDKACGSPGRRNFYAREYECRASVARLLGCPVDDVALVSSATEALAILANSLGLKPGDEVVINDLEFPSNVLPWLRLRDAGVVVRVAHAAGGRIALEDFAAVIGPRTRLVTISQVSYKTGTHFPYLAALGALAHQAGAVFCVDATQALGRLPVALTGVDYLVASTYKWMLGVHGLGVLYCAPELRQRLIPSSMGWYSVNDVFGEQRFERFTLKADAVRFMGGMPNFPGIYALKTGVDFLLQVGVENIDRGLRPLVARLRQGLADRGLELLTPPDPELASGIVSVATPNAREAGSLLDERGIHTWYGDGRVRASVHLYNDEEDIERYLAVLPEVLAPQDVTHG